MSATDFWDGDAYLAYCYRKAEEMRFERTNTYMHIMGAYAYDALIATANGYAWGQNGGKGKRPSGYTENKYAFTTNEKKEKEEREREEARLFFERGQ